MLETAKELGILVISDEIHSDLVHPGKKHIPMNKVNETIGADCITLFAPSKTFNIAGEHSAFVVFSSEEMRDTFRKREHAMRLDEPSIVIGELASSAYEHGLEYNNELCAYLGDNVRKIDEFLKASGSGMKMVNAEASFVAFLDCIDVYDKVKAEVDAHPEKYTGGKGGGSAPAVVENFTLDSSINSLKIVVGKLGEGSPGELGTSNGTISGGSGGAGGGASYISDGTNILAAAAGSGGGGGASACLADGSFVAIGGAGGKGASIGNLEGGAGGAQNSSCIAGTHDGNAGKSGKLSTGPSCASTNRGGANEDGIVWILSSDYYSESNTAGNSGKCYYNPSIDVVPGERIQFKVNSYVIGSADVSTVYKGKTYTTADGTYQNMASGDIPGAGFSARCQPGTYGAGAEKKPLSTYRYLIGVGGYIAIEY